MRTANESSKTKDIRYMDIWLADLPLIKGSHVQGGRRPVIVVSNDTANQRSNMVSMVPMTTNLKRSGYPTHVLLSGSGLDRESLALCEQVRAIDKHKLIFRIGHIAEQKDVMAVKQALTEQLGLVA